MNAMTKPSFEEQLAVAERDLICAQMIDEWSRCQRETAECERRIASIKRKIAERDEHQHVENGVAALGDRHAG